MRGNNFKGSRFSLKKKPLRYREEKETAKKHYKTEDSTFKDFINEFKSAAVSRDVHECVSSNKTLSGRVSFSTSEQFGNKCGKLGRESR